MRRGTWRLVGGVTLLVLLGGGAAAVAMTRSPDQGKQASLASNNVHVLTLTEQEKVITGSRFTFSHASNEVSGPSDEVADVKAAASALVEQRNNLKDLPAAVSQRLAQVNDPNEAAAMAARVNTIWDAQVSQAALADLQAELRLRSETAAIEQMLSTTVTVTHWNVVLVKADAATVVFTADTRRQSATTTRWVDEGLSQFRLTLHRSADLRWRLVSVTSASLGGQG